MTLKIETFSNVSGGNALYKALAHPLAAEQIETLVLELAVGGPVAIYDPLGQAESFRAIYDIDHWDCVGVFVQDVDAIGENVLGKRAAPVTEIGESGAVTVFIAAFDASRLTEQVRHLFPVGAKVVSFDQCRLPDTMLTNRRRYLDPLNFATNFGFFRDSKGHHTRIGSANYWFGHGAHETSIWLRLYNENGDVIAEWEEELASTSGSYSIDSYEIRKRFDLDDFTGSLFMHVIGTAGHDNVKYVVDTYGDDPTVLSGTHDANAWPADYYAGLPAPHDGERVVLWVQNSHPVPIPAGAIGLNLMGGDNSRWLDQTVAPFGTCAIDVSELLPDARWPDQIEVRAGRHFVRPRYEVSDGNGRSRMAHANVERTDLTPDPKIAELANLMGKGYILAAPILPLERWKSFALPTPMARDQEQLPLAALLVDGSGVEVARHNLGCVARDECPALDLNALLEKSGATLASGYGHVELVYDFSDGGNDAADGWLHGLFRYVDRESGHTAETSFGAHIYNIPITYRNEPQSYIGQAPGLSTRLFLRLGRPPFDSLCQLIYPSSMPWRDTSSTDIVLNDETGNEVGREHIEIPCGGSRLLRYSEMFDAKTRKTAGAGAHIMVRDTTCRLFGYQGLLNGHGAFSFDHMFGF